MAKVAYTGDLHLEFLVSNLQEKYNRDFSIKDVAEIFCAELHATEHNFAVIAGDMSHCPADVIRFLEEVDKDAPKPIFVILGNHDYWNWASSIVCNANADLPSKNVQDIETWFKTKFSKFENIKLLIAGDKYVQDGIAIIGDCGFAAYNYKFNYRNGIYRGTIHTAQEEKDLSDRWRKFYEQEAFSGDKTLIITHHPPTDWGYNYEDEGNERVYIFAHVHDIDTRTCTGVEIIKQGNYYGDAANGYHKHDAKLKVLEIK